MNERKNYDEAVKVIKTAILQSQYDAAAVVNGKQLMLYYSIGKYISANSRNGFWGKGAIDAISERLDKELPGLRGFSGRSLRYMRTFYEEWSYLENNGQQELESCTTDLAPAGAESTNKAEITIWHPSVPKVSDFPMDAFLAIGFSHHRTILSKVKDRDAHLFYIQECAAGKFSRDALECAIARDDFHHQGNLPNNFMQTISAADQALRAINTFKDEYLLDYINVEELGVRDRADIDERVVENAIIHNIQKLKLRTPISHQKLRIYLQTGESTNNCAILSGKSAVKSRPSQILCKPQK